MRSTPVCPIFSGLTLLACCIVAVAAGLLTPSQCQAQSKGARLFIQPLNLWNQLELERLVTTEESINVPARTHSLASGTSDLWDSLVQSTLRQVRVALGALQNSNHRSPLAPRILTNSALFLQQTSLLAPVMAGPSAQQLLQGLPYAVTLQSTRSGFGVLFAAVAFP